VCVPQPYNFLDGVLLMDLVTDAHGDAAPLLNDLEFSPEDARVHHATLLTAVVRMLCAGVVHGDLSEFNILLGEHGPVIIDLPQAVDAAGNNHAQRMLLRDVGNLNGFFGRFAPELLHTPAWCRDLGPVPARRAASGGGAHRPLRAQARGGGRGRRAARDRQRAGGRGSAEAAVAAGAVSPSDAQGALHRLAAHLHRARPHRLLGRAAGAHQRGGSGGTSGAVCGGMSSMGKNRLPHSPLERPQHIRIPRTRGHRVYPRRNSCGGTRH
jgi:serine/threonine-protein kinase RIO1